MQNARFHKLSTIMEMAVNKLRAGISWEFSGEASNSRCDQLVSLSVPGRGRGSVNQGHSTTRPRQKRSQKRKANNSVNE